MAPASGRLQATRFGSAVCRFIVLILLELLPTWLKALADAAVAVTCADVASALDCGRGEVEEACSLRGLSISPMCYCDLLHISRYCSDACDVRGETPLCASRCQAYLEYMRKSCSPPDAGSGWPAELVVAIVLGTLGGLASLFVISTALRYTFDAATNGESRSARGYWRFLLHLGRIEGHPAVEQPVNLFPGCPTDTIVVGNNCSTATVPPPHTALSHDLDDGQEHQEFNYLLQRSV